jgi:DNA modification methylase
MQCEDYLIGGVRVFEDIISKLNVPYRVIGDCLLTNGDCMEVMKLLPKVDAVVTDPPYGIGADSHAGNSANGWTQWEVSDWDKKRPALAVFDLIRLRSKLQIIWGGNYFTDYLPPSMQWLIWDKGQRDFSLADCEIAWSSQNKASRIFDYSRSKALQDGKQHPTQKPVGVMKWCIKQLPDYCKTILDPFMGSGTTLVACAKIGRIGIGIELEPKYYEIACKRVEEAYRQPDMFIETPKASVQEALQLL